MNEWLTPLEDVASGKEWSVCEALLTFHAISDEACAGLGVALDRSDGEGCVYRSRGRELLARTGSLARIPPHLLRVLTKMRTPPRGTSLRSFSRYAFGVHRCPDFEVEELTIFTGWAEGIAEALAFAPECT